LDQYVIINATEKWNNAGMYLSCFPNYANALDGNDILTLHKFYQADQNDSTET
jgi:hypothetical protein